MNLSTKSALSQTPTSPSISLAPADLSGYLAPSFPFRNAVLPDLAQISAAQADAFLWCGSRFLGVRTCDQDLQHSQAVPVLCHLRYCPTCAPKDSARLVASHAPQIKSIIGQADKNYRLRSITLTTPILLFDPAIRVKIALYLAWINALFDHFCGGKLSPSNRHRWSEPHSKFYTGEGFIGAFEFGEHCKLHFHILFFGRWIDKFKLTTKWRELSAGESDVTWIKHVSKADAAIHETLKYITKFPAGKHHDELTGDEPLFPPPSTIAALAFALNGFRRVFARGCFRGLGGDEPGQEDARDTCPLCGAHAPIRSLAEWATIWWPIYAGRAKLARLDLRPGNNSEARSSGVSPPEKPVFGQLVRAREVLASYHKSVRKQDRTDQAEPVGGMHHA